MKLKYKEMSNLIFQTAKKRLEKQGRDIVLDEDVKRFYRLLTLYFTEDKEFEKEALKTKEGKINYNLKKGLLVLGTPGRSKSFLFEDILPEIFYKYQRESIYKKTTTDIIVSQYKEHQEKAVNLYQKNYTQSELYFDVYIDELGAEAAKINIYGNEINPLIHFLNFRYRVFKDYGKKTYATSNLKLTELCNFYSERIYSRFFEMFNIVVLKGSDLRIQLYKTETVKSKL